MEHSMSQYVNKAEMLKAVMAENERLRAQLAAAQQTVDVTDNMALAFHQALTDGALGADELEDIKTGLRAALSHVQPPQKTAAPQLAQQPLTDEHKATLKECRNQAMGWTLDARIPECGIFSGIDQDLDYLCEQLGVKND